MRARTIREIHGMASRTDGVGIEVEVESKTPLPTDIGGVWIAHDDYSLRDHCKEYVCRQPIKVDANKITHIKLLTDRLNTAGNKISMSHRTSVHVHRNVQEFTPAEVWTALVAYWMIEDPILDFCGDTRRGNLFCLPLSKCDGIIARCIKDASSSNTRPFSSFTPTYCKYGGQNLATIASLGSIEYRSMRGTTDPGLIDEWSTALYTLGTNAKNKFGTPDVLMDYYLDNEKSDLLNELLPKSFVTRIERSPNYIGLIRENVLRLCDLAYLHEDWRKWELNLTEPKKKIPIKNVSATFWSSDLVPAQTTSSGNQIFDID